MHKDLCTKIMNYDVLTHSLEELDLDRKQVINTLNPHSYIIAKEDMEFEGALHGSDVLIPDGSGIVLAAKWLYGKKIDKIAGSDLHQFLLNKMDLVSGKVFYMGASEETIEKIRHNIEQEYPHVQVEGYAPPYKNVFSDKDNERMFLKINAFEPDVLFIGMTAPKQEKWLHEHKAQLTFTTACCIGAVFDFYAGNIPRSGQLWIDLHLEWFPRFMREPRRLWRRNLVSTPLFLLDLLLYKIRLKR